MTMPDRSPRDEQKELRKLQKTLTPEQAFRLVNDAIEVRLKALSAIDASSKLLPEDRLLFRLDIRRPW
jgi:hypothetical protein